MMSLAVRRVMIWWVERIAARPGLVVLAMSLVALWALDYTARNLRIDTATADMLSADIPFRQNEIAFRRAFPQFAEPIVAVIRGETPERAERAARALAEALATDREHFVAADAPESEPFLVGHALLYLDLPDLGALVDRLSAAQPLLAVLAEDPSLRGIAHLVALALEGAPDTDALPPEIDRLLGAIAETTEAMLAGRPGELSWQSLLQSGTAAPTLRLVTAQPKLDFDTMTPAGAAIEALRGHARALGIDASQGLRLDLTGSAMLDQEELQSASSGALFAFVLSTAVVAALLVWGLGSVRLIAATLITLAIGLLATAGLATLMIGRLNLISITFAVLFVGLGVDFGIHVALRYREFFYRERDHHPALREAVAGIGAALSLSALCAALGFLGFVPTSYLGLAELGVISAIGMAVAWFTSLTLLPALLCLMPLQPARLGTPPAPRLLPGIERHSRAVLTISVLLGLASLALLPRIAFDFNPINLKDPKSESVRTFRILEADPTTSPHTIEILAPDLEHADAMARRLEARDEVGQAITLSSFVPDAQEDKLQLIDTLALYLGPALQVEPKRPPDPTARARAFAELRASLDRGPKGRLAAGGSPGALRLAHALANFAEVERASAEPLRELEERLVRFLPELLDQLRDALALGPVGLGDLPPDLRARWVNPAGEARVLVLPKARIAGNQDLRAFADAVLAEVPHATGVPVIVTKAGDAVIRAFKEASWWALGLITLLLALVFRNLRDILMVLAPLALAVLLTAASAVLLGIELNFANVIVLPLLLGLGVSGAVHVVIRWHQLAGGADVAVTSTPRAVVFSELTTIASFGSLALSSHRGLASMGALLTIAIVWSLVCMLVVLPCMLTLFGGARPPDRKTPGTPRRAT